MVIKGAARGGPGQLAAHLQRTDTNERMRVVEQRGVAADDLKGALKEMDALGAALRTDRTLYHASINTRADERMTPEQWTTAIDRLEARLGFTGQPRFVVEHAKEGREHVHIVWSRTDLEHMRAIRCDHNYRAHEEVARDLEREFGHERVQGAHAEREGQDGHRSQRPDRTPSHAEMQQAERTGLTPKEAKAEITAIWQTTDSGKAFAAALEEHNWILARGDKRDFVVLDHAGEAHSLARRVEGVKAAGVRERMADVDAASLPTVIEARALQLERQVQQEAALRPVLLPEVTDEADKPSSSGTLAPMVATDSGGMVAQQREANRLLARRENSGGGRALEGESPRGAVAVRGDTATDRSTGPQSATPEPSGTMGGGGSRDGLSARQPGHANDQATQGAQDRPPATVTSEDARLSRAEELLRGIEQRERIRRSHGSDKVPSKDDHQQDHGNER